MDEFQRAWNEAPATSGIDPNTGLAPVAVETIGAQHPSNEETYVDEWNRAPDEAAPVRTWIDPAAREGSSDYVAAWQDEPAAAEPEVTPLADAVEAAAPAVEAAPVDDTEYIINYDSGYGAEGAGGGGAPVIYDPRTGKIVEDADPVMLRDSLARRQAGAPYDPKRDRITAAEFRRPPSAATPAPAPAAAAPAAPAAPAPAAVSPTPNTVVTPPAAVAPPQTLTPGAAA